MPAAKYRAGDLFALPLPAGDWLTGRVLLDVDTVLDKRIVTSTSPLRTHKGSVLVEVYSAVSDKPSGSVSGVLVPGQWVMSDALTGRAKPTWPIVGHEEVNPEAVDFPEEIIATDPTMTFAKGEIQQPISVARQEKDRFRVGVLFHNCARFVAICEYFLGRKENLGRNPEGFSLARDDLRFSPIRGEVYKMLKRDPSRAYAEWAREEGLDPARLWK